MAARFPLLATLRPLGWALGVGDALRASGKALGVIMLDPTATACGCAPPLVRVRVGRRVSVLEIRQHNASRCTRGRWQRLDSADTPGNARGWRSLLRFWSWHVGEFTSGRDPWVWADLLEGDPNLCRTRADADRHEPSPGGGPGRGRKVKSPPGAFKALGYAPATGPNAGTRKVRGPEVPPRTLGCEREAQLDAAAAERAEWFEGITNAQRARKLFR
jgi:hypothetical protein